MTEDEMVGWHHWLNGHEFEQTPGESEGRESLVRCRSWGHKESDTTEQQDSGTSATCSSCSLPSSPGPRLRAGKDFMGHLPQLLPSQLQAAGKLN